MFLSEDLHSNAMLLLLIFLFSSKSHQVGSGKDHYHIFLVTSICTQLVTHLGPESSINVQKKCDLWTTHKGPLCPKRTKWGSCSIVGQNVVLMRTFVIIEELIGSTALLILFESFQKKPKIIWAFYEKIRYTSKIGKYEPSDNSGIFVCAVFDIEGMNTYLSGLIWKGRT